MIKADDPREMFALFTDTLGSPLRACLDELQRRGVTYGLVRPLIVTDSMGAKQRLFTNVTLLGLSDAPLPVDAAMHIFLERVQPDLRRCRRPTCHDPQSNGR